MIALIAEEAERVYLKVKMMNKVTDDSYLIKLKRLNLSDERIAQKLGVPVEVVQERWRVIQQIAEALARNGHQALIDHFTILCNQYQLLGQSLKIMAGALANEATQEELKAAITTSPEATLANLHHFIILRPFISITPEEALKREIQSQ